MANLDTLRKALDSHLQDNWNRNTITWDNTTRPLTENSEWIRPTLSLETSDNVTIGGANGHSRVRYTGSYIIQVFSPLTKGTGDIYRAVDKLITTFNNQRLKENIFTYACEITRVGDEGNGWYQVNVSIPFTSDQLADD
jgi:hypothetical protein